MVSFVSIHCAIRQMLNKIRYFFPKNSGKQWFLVNKSKISILATNIQVNVSEFRIQIVKVHIHFNTLQYCPLQ